MTTYPYIFKDLDKWSETYGQWCVRWSESWSEDGFKKKQEALNQIHQYFWDKDKESTS